MSLAVKMLHSIIMKDTERQTRFLINFLRIFLQMCLFLNPLKLSEQKHRGIFNLVLLPTFLKSLRLLLDNIPKNSMIYRYAIDIINLLD